MSNLWERAKEALVLARNKTVNPNARAEYEGVLADMEQAECVEGVADSGYGFWRETKFAHDRPALLILEPKP